MDPHHAVPGATLKGSTGSPGQLGSTTARAVLRCRTGLLIITLALTGCVVNPVTGTREFGWVTTADQIAIGRQQYLPAQQMQGGRYTLDPALTEYVTGVGRRLAAVSDADLPYEFVVLNNGVPNAWALPGGKIAINRGLLVELSNEAELAAVLGHEIVHAAARHGAKSIERGTLLSVGLLGAAIGSRDSRYANAVVGGVQIGAQLINQAYSRNAERESDYYGTRYLARAGYDPMAAVTLQQTFLRLSEGRDVDALDAWFASHPTSAERVENNRQLVADLREEGFIDGEFGAERYEAALRRLRTDAPAYAAYDAARAAQAADEHAEALRQIEEAIRLQPREGLFHALRGDLRLEAKRHGDAITNYDRAVERSAPLFSIFLGRGLAHNALGERDAARADLQKSVELLPTSAAYLVLGELAEADGGADSALAYYQAATQSSGAVAKEAAVRLVRLDLPRHPERYLITELLRDAQGRLLLRVVNQTPVALAAVTLKVVALDAAGLSREVSPRVELLAAGEQRLIALGRSEQTLVDARARVLSARVAADG